MQQVLTLNLSGAPVDWVSLEHAITYHAQGKVVADLGARHFVFHGGINRQGERSEISTSSIIMLRGRRHATLSANVPLSNPALFARDRNICAYCGALFRPGSLTRDHVLPLSRGGKDVWENVVTACLPCNHDRKRNQTPAEAGLTLLYAPYKPNRYEHFILVGRNVLADQMEYLLSGVPRHSRLL